MTWKTTKGFEEALPVCPVCKNPLVFYEWRALPTVKFYCGLTLNHGGRTWNVVMPCRKPSEDALKLPKDDFSTHYLPPASNI